MGCDEVPPTADTNYQIIYDDEWCVEWQQVAKNLCEFISNTNWATCSTGSTAKWYHSMCVQVC